MSGVLRDHDSPSPRSWLATGWRGPPPGIESRCLGAAVDIGTTTVVAYLVDLTTGERLATASDLNPQARHGHDPISRIEYVQKQRRGLDDLRRPHCISSIDYWARRSLMPGGGAAIST